MQNTYIKELATRTFQEGLVITPSTTKKVVFHFPSFFVGILVSIVGLGVV